METAAPASPSNLCFLKEIAKLYPSADEAMARIASLEASLTLPKETIHVISDIHGEYKKLRHVINNASGSLRPLVDELFEKKLSAEKRMTLLNLIHYPSESWTMLQSGFQTAAHKDEFLLEFIGYELILLRAIAEQNRLSTVEEVIPPEYRELFRELLFAPQLKRTDDYLKSVIGQFIEQGKDLDLVRLLARVLRNILVSELVVAGDMGDRGPRIDRVISYIMHQPRVSITWGNHDTSWIGACLGHEACIATVIRISMRYGRLTQLEEGYGISLTALENLARNRYGQDPCERFASKGDSLREPILMARMQKAIAIMQFKLEGQLIKRNPQLGLSSRNLLHLINPDSKTVTIDGKQHPMLDSNFPTIDWSDPYRLSSDEEQCISGLKASFLHSPVLWIHMKYLVERGCMYLRRDKNLIFHACVPVDESGNFLPLTISGQPLAGRALFDALTTLVPRALRSRNQSDLDMLWYLWSGPLSPLFGKDKMATFESYFIADKETHKETKNPYFKLIHHKDFCLKILAEFGVHDADALIVNGHVPVKIEKGESPLKDSGLAVTIDGAFSEAYGDKGYSLVLEAHRTYLAQHHHFDSALDSIMKGSDIIPHIQELRSFEPVRKIADTEEGTHIRQQIEMLRLLIQGYQDNLLRD